MHLIQNPYICSVCWNVASEFYKLKLKCLQNELRYLEFLAKNQWQGGIQDFVLAEYPIIQKQSSNVLEIDDEAVNKIDISVDKSDSCEDTNYSLLRQLLELGNYKEADIDSLNINEKKKVYIFLEMK